MFFALEHSWRKVIVNDPKRAIEWVEHMKTLTD